MKKRNRIISKLLVAIMVLALVPFFSLTVFADGGYTVTLYANDGQGTQEQIENVSGLYVLPECEFTPPPEMTFLAWAIGSQSGEQKQPGAAINITEDTLIVAIWTESAAIYETRPNGGVTTVNGAFEIRYRLTLQPDTMFIEFYNEYQGAWAEKYALATMPEYEGALTHFYVPIIHKDTEETIKFRLRACKDGIDYYSNEFVVKYTNNRFTNQPTDAMVSPGEEYNVVYAMSFTPSSVTVEYKDGNLWKHYSNASESGATLSAGDGEKVIIFRVKAIYEGDVYYSHEFTVRWATVTEVGTFSELLNAVNSDKTYIKFATSITDDVPNDELPTKHRLLFDGGKDYVLDLGPYMLYVRNTSNEFYIDNFSMIGVTNNSKLTIKGGNIRFENYYVNSRASKGVISVSDTSSLVVEGANVKNHQTGPVVYAEGDANVTIYGGEYVVQNGFALYMKQQANLTLDDGVYVHTVMGDCAETTFNNGYGALYSESTGELVIKSAFFESGVQVHESQIGAFDTSTHEVVINGQQITENIFTGNFYEATQQNKPYYWYDFHMRALFKVGEYGSFVNKVRVISYDKKSPITVVNGTATIDGVPVTEACYGQEVTIVADEPEAGKEFVCWEVLGGGVDYPFDPTSTLTMAPNAMTITACYGNASITTVDITIKPPKAGETPSMTVTTSSQTEFVSMEWYLVGHGAVLEENDVFYPGFDYGVRILLYPEADYKFANTVTTTVNGENAVVTSGNAGYVIVQYEFAALPANPFNVSYKSGYQTGVDGQIELDIDSMKNASSAFSDAFDADKVSYQWYRDGEAIEGATGSSYTFVNDDVESNIHCVVTANELVSYGYTVMCTKDLYKVSFNLSEIVSGGRAPELTSATPGVAVIASSYVICEKYSEISFGSILDTSQMILIPGKTYRIVALYEVIDFDINVGSNASFYVNGNEAEKDGWRIIYDFTVPATGFELSVTCEDVIGIGAELVAEEIAGATYQWYRNGEVIKGATASSYIVVPSDKDSLIHCVATKGDGSCGYSSQYFIGHIITVIRLSGPTPRNSMLVGEVKSNKFSANGASVTIGWWIGTADDIINHECSNSEFLDDNDYAFVEGTNYVLHVIFVDKDTYTIHDNATAYYNGIKGIKNSYRQYLFDVKALHTHVYDDNVWAHDDEYHWHPCVAPGCTNPNEEEKDIMFHYGTEATCQVKGKCSVCEYEYYGEHDVAVPNYVYIDDMRCGTYCATEGCDYLSEWSYHTGGTFDCQHKAVCEICHHEYGKLGEHFPEEEWASDGEYHWHECKNCDGEQLDKQSHTGNATCIEKAICTVCEVEFGDFAEHAEYSQTWDYKDANGHAHVCTFDGCNAFDEIVPHTPGPEATENDPQICTDCGYIIVPATGHVVHTPKAEWKSDGTYHWHECTGCEGQQLEKSAHSGGVATCTARAVCAGCGNEYGELVPHEYTIENGYKGADGHANTCSCGAHETPIAHNPDRLEATETEPIKCTVCGYIITPATGHINHTSKAEWKTDADSHWHECTGCEGQQLEKAEHEDGDSDDLCDECGYDMTVKEELESESESEVESESESESTSQESASEVESTSQGGTTSESLSESQPKLEEPKDGLSGGAIAGIVVGSVVVLGFGGFALFWFVIKKKTWAEFLAIFKKK